MTGRRVRWVAVGAAAALVVAGWAIVRTGGEQARSGASTADYLPGVAADIYLPPTQPAKPAKTGSTPTAGKTRVPVVVLVPGGAWLTADRTGLGPLAESLAAHGIVAVNATYRAVNSGARFPQPVADIVCAIDFAADRARRAGFVPGPVIVLGHSSGGHLAALAALGATHFRTGCPYPPARIGGLVGLSGAYNVLLLQDLAYPLFGVRATANAALWRDGNPMNWAKARTANPAIPVLLAHGSADDVLPRSFTLDFAQALEDGSHPVQVKIVPGADHATIYTPGVIADTVATWTNSLADPR